MMVPAKSSKVPAKCFMVHVKLHWRLLVLLVPVRMLIAVSAEVIQGGGRMCVPLLFVWHPNSKFNLDAAEFNIALCLFDLTQQPQQQYPKR